MERYQTQRQLDSIRHDDRCEATWVGKKGWTTCGCSQRSGNKVESTMISGNSYFHGLLNDAVVLIKQGLEIAEKLRQENTRLKEEKTRLLEANAQLNARIDELEATIYDISSGAE
jgi:hypothetical protein